MSHLPPDRLPRLVQLSRWVLSALLAAAVLAIGYFGWQVHKLGQLAAAHEQEAAPQLAARVRAVANVEQLLAFGQQLAVSPTREAWLAAGASMQALSFHPSLAELRDPDGATKGSFALAQQLMHLRENGADAALVSALWQAHARKLENVADEGAVQLVALSTSMAQTTQRAAQDMFNMLLGGATLAVGALVGLLHVVRRQTLNPLTAMARRLFHLHAGTTDTVDLPPPGNQEVAEVFEALREFERAREELQASEARWRFALEGAGDGVWEYHFDAHVNVVSARIREMVGLAVEQGAPPQPLPGWSRRLTPQSLAVTRDAVAAIEAGSASQYRVEQQVRCEDGSYKWLLARGMVMARTSDGRPLRMIGTSSDITARKQSEQRLQLAASVFEHAREGIMITDRQGTIIEVNATFTELTGYTHDEAVGREPRMLQSGRQAPEFYRAMWEALAQNGYWTGEIWNRHKSGELFAVMQTISAVRDAQGVLQNYVSLFTDITPMKAHQQELEYIAHYDLLTHLPNRVLLADRLRQAMLQTQRRDLSLAVAYLDLDGFKEVNDIHGHHVGDELLVTIAKRMKEALREGDTLARMGGDEFVVVLSDLAQPQDCEPVLQRLLIAASAPVQHGPAADVVQVSASIGVAMFPQDDADADLLLRHADQAMYLAKQGGKNRYHMFDVQADDARRLQQEGVEQIRSALTQDQFVLFYQPKVNMLTNEVVGAEALIRWQHPERGLLAPGMFLPAIENHPMAVDLGEWVIQAALAQMERWHQVGLHLRVSVNIGARQLQQPDFVTRLAVLLARFPSVAPASLELEILETSALSDIADVSSTLRACMDLGVTFALDDFGTGYSSLTYLRHLPASVLKIDQSFVRDMLIDPDDCAIVSGVIGLAGNFGRQVIAEGVETQQHGVQLKALGCQVGQGYGIARPMPADVLPDWVANWTATVEPA